MFDVRLTLMSDGYFPSQTVNNVVNVLHLTSQYVWMLINLKQNVCIHNITHLQLRSAADLTSLCTGGRNL